MKERRGGLKFYSIELELNDKLNFTWSCIKFGVKYFGSQAGVKSSWKPIIDAGQP